MNIQSNRSTEYAGYMPNFSLQNPLSNTSPSTPTRGKRTFSPARKGSITIEASLALPIAVMLSIAVIHFLLIISLQSSIQLRIDETAREIGKHAYLDEGDGILTDIATNPLLLKAEIVNSNLSDLISGSQISGGADGLHTFLSTYDSKTGILDLVVSYTYKVPLLPGNFSTMHFVQRSRSRVWIGKELKDMGEAPGKDESRTVYITPTGTAYHISPSCPYLDLSISAADGLSVSSLRNANGGIYYRCSLCGQKGTTGIVYITDYGNLWHSSLGCSRLKRTVYAVKLEDVGTRHKCPKCGG